MHLILKLAVTIAVGAMGGITAKKLRFIPAAYMMGALFFILAFNLTVGYTYFPYALRVFTQALAGMYLGMRIRRKDLIVIRDILSSVLLLMFLFLLLTLGVGYTIHRASGMDLLTAMYACAPGGVSDIGLIADSFGADAGAVTLLQLVRLITVFLYYPFLYSFFEKKGIIKTKRNGTKKADPASSPKEAEPDNAQKRKGLLIVLFFSGIGAALGFLSKIPAGTMVFAMLFAIITHLVYEKAYFPSQIRIVTQLLSGIYLGMRMTRETIAALPEFLFPTLIIIASVLILPLIFGILLHKITKLDLSTSLFACTPGGMMEMSLLADDMGLDVVKVSVTHVVRVMMVVSIFPYIINFFAN